MKPHNHESGWSLLVAGVGGVVFFWCSDPHSAIGGWLSGGAIDAANQAWAGTIVGLAGSTLVLALGAWLLTRRVA